MLKIEMSLEDLEAYNELLKLYEMQIDRENKNLKNNKNQMKENIQNEKNSNK